MNSGDIVAISIFATDSVTPYVSRCYAPLTRIQQMSLFMRYHNNNHDDFILNENDVTFTTNDLTEPQFLSRTLINGHILLLIATPLANIVECERILGCVTETVNYYMQSNNDSVMLSTGQSDTEITVPSQTLEPLKCLSILDEAVQASLAANADMPVNSSVLRMRVEMFSEHEQKVNEEHAEKLREQQAKIEAAKREAERQAASNTNIVTKGISKLSSFFGFKGLTKSAQNSVGFGSGQSPSDPRYAGFGSSALTEEQKAIMRKNNSQEFYPDSITRNRDRTLQQNDKYAGFGSSSFNQTSYEIKESKEDVEMDVEKNDNKNENGEETDKNPISPQQNNMIGIGSSSISKKKITMNSTTVIPKVLIHGNKEKVAVVNVSKGKGVTF